MNTLIRNYAAGKMVLMADACLAVTLRSQAQTVSVARQGTDVKIEWIGSGRLQSAPLISGPWTDLPPAASPYVLQPLSAAQFFRLRNTIDVRLPAQPLFVASW